MTQETNGFIIVSPGDPSVGIFKTQWELTGYFQFDSEADLNEFRSLIKQAFEMVADDAYVSTIEETIAWIKKETKGSQ